MPVVLQQLKHETFSSSCQLAKVVAVVVVFMEVFWEMVEGWWCTMLMPLALAPVTALLPVRG